MKKLITILLVLAMLLPIGEALAEGIDTSLPMENVLDALGKKSYRTTYEALLEGEILEKGAEGDVAKGLQKTLAAFGEDITADGKAGGKTFKALNKVQKKFGLEETETLDAEGYAQLLRCLAVYEDVKDAEDLVLAAGTSMDEYYYILARKMEADKKYYSAKKYYEYSEWADWEERAEDCIQDWPSDGRVWKSNSRIGSGSTLILKVENTASYLANVFKVYNSDKKLVAVLFIGGNGTASTSLTPGKYYIKRGIGEEWYGRKECFGNEGFYYTLRFGADRSKRLTFSWGDQWTITFNTEDYVPEENQVITDSEGWDDF